MIKSYEEIVKESTNIYDIDLYNCDNFEEIVFQKQLNENVILRCKEVENKCIREFNNYEKEVLFKYIKQSSIDGYSNAVITFVEMFFNTFDRPFILYLDKWFEEFYKYLGKNAFKIYLEDDEINLLKECYAQEEMAKNYFYNTFGIGYYSKISIILNHGEEKSNGLEDEFFTIEPEDIPRLSFNYLLSTGILDTMNDSQYNEKDFMTYLNTFIEKELRNSKKDVESLNLVELSKLSIKLLNTIKRDIFKYITN